ncbi:MAG TPA: potassium-transporting ATPase subunit KdpC [Candidatus Dormibacteraeota bacterium]|jgi:K+-transporting ATPase ATPase C chain|nr:potassium-transporting ATPase subunit KdpC [Candidatus Dormibacteraeota bacterium]
MIASLPKELVRAIRLTLVFGAMSLVYGLVMTGFAQGVFHNQANGSLITHNGQVVGSSLIGQEFTSPRYFQGRPSATENATTDKPQPYNAANSAGSNLGPNNAALIQRVAAQVKQIRKQDGLGPNSTVPVDLVTTDFSGFDPDISEAAALIQVDRVAKARGLDSAKVRTLVDSLVQGRILGVFGEPYVNVLALNLALDQGAAR